MSLSPGIIVAIIGLAAVAALATKGHAKQIKASVTPLSGWMFGPRPRGVNYTKGMPERPTMQGAGWTFTFPGPGGEVDAVVNYSPGSLVGAKSLIARYAVTGSEFMASEESNVPGRVGICLQRRGDDWSGTGKYQQYRLYGQDRPLLVAGEGQFEASAFTDVQGKVVAQAVVDAVLADLDNYAIVFGGTFASHGVHAAESSSFTLLALDVVR